MFLRVDGRIWVQKCVMSFVTTPNVGWWLRILGLMWVPALRQPTPRWGDHRHSGHLHLWWEDESGLGHSEKQSLQVNQRCPFWPGSRGLVHQCRALVGPWLLVPGVCPVLSQDLAERFGYKPSDKELEYSSCGCNFRPTALEEFGCPGMIPKVKVALGKPPTLRGFCTSHYPATNFPSHIRMRVLCTGVMGCSGRIEACWSWLLGFPYQNGRQLRWHGQHLSQVSLLPHQRCRHGVYRPVTVDAMTLYLKKELPRTGKLG